MRNPGVVTVGLIFGVGLLVAPTHAVAGGRRDHSYACVCLTLNSTTAANNPALDGGTAIAVPTVSLRQWEGRINWGFQADVTAGIMSYLHVGYVTDDKGAGKAGEVQFLGADVGYAFGFLGGGASLNIVVDSAYVSEGDVVGTAADSKLYADVGLQFHATHRVGDKVWVNAKLQLARTGSDKLKGTDVAAVLDGTYRFTRHLGVYASLGFDLRVIKDDNLEHKEYSLSTVMMKVGVAFMRPED